MKMTWEVVEDLVTELQYVAMLLEKASATLSELTKRLENIQKSIDG